MSAPEHVLRVARGTAEGQQSVSVSGVSAQTTNAIGSPTAVVYSNVEAFALAGSNPSASVAAGTPIAAGQMIRFTGIQPGDKLAFITAGATGTVYVRPGA
jgi:hypothetical protein